MEKYDCSFVDTKPFAKILYLDLEHNLFKGLLLLTKCYPTTSFASKLVPMYKSKDSQLTKQYCNHKLCFQMIRFNQQTNWEAAATRCEVMASGVAFVYNPKSFLLFSSSWAILAQMAK